MEYAKGSHHELFPPSFAFYRKAIGRLQTCKSPLNSFTTKQRKERIIFIITWKLYFGWEVTTSIAYEPWRRSAILLPSLCLASSWPSCIETRWNRWSASLNISLSKKKLKLNAIGNSKGLSKKIIPNSKKWFTNNLLKCLCSRAFLINLKEMVIHDSKNLFFDSFCKKL